MKGAKIYKAYGDSALLDLDFQDYMLQLKNISKTDFAIFGLDQVAYVRPLDVQGKRMYALNSADGKLLSMQDSESMAAVVAMHNNLEPVVVH